jgi:hypothetical protein
MVMIQTLTHTVFSMWPPVVLKPRLMQVDLDLVEDEEAPCDALQRMAIGDVRLQDPNDQSQ